MPCSVDNIEHILRLEKLGFLSSAFVCQISGQTLSAEEERFTITDSVRSYMMYCDAGMRKRLMEWIRYGITTVIALAGLITAIISIAMQQS